MLEILSLVESEQERNRPLAIRGFSPPKFEPGHAVEDTCRARGGGRVTARELFHKLAIGGVETPKVYFHSRAREVNSKMEKPAAFMDKGLRAPIDASGMHANAPMISRPQFSTQSLCIMIFGRRSARRTFADPPEGTGGNPVHLLCAPSQPSGNEG